MSGTPASVQDIVARLHSIEGELPSSDGAAVFDRMYTTVTEHVAAGLAGTPIFRDPAFMAQLDVRFAGMWLEAYDAPSDSVPKAWAPLFERRHSDAVLPIQFALAGMNAHIAHDLPLAVVATCVQLDTSPDDAKVHEDYDKINHLLSACESEIRRSFLSDAGQAVDDRFGPVIHLIDSWNIDKAREVAWVTAEALWEMRRVGSLADRFEAALARTVGMASRCLLTPVMPS
jgi:Family of unknown function (DUF5995)